MERRSFLKIGVPAALGAALPARGQSEAPAVRRVLLVAKCHLDVGFTQTQTLVMRKYFDVYYPQAIETAARLREAGEDRYRWTTGSWLLYEYLEQASPADRKRVEASVASGDITWHALPFSWQTEMLDRSMIAGGLGFSAELDRRFGRKTIGAKMTDVPGHSRGLVAPLSAAGVRLLDIGVNAASTPPDVPELFLWKNAGGDALAVLYHRHDYGSVAVIPGSATAVAVEVRNDNSGPHTLEEIAAIYAKLRAQFPGATVEASDLNAVAAAVEPVRASLPVVVEEIGDTWIYGAASDPGKVARYRELARLRREWVARGRFAEGDATDRALLRRLLLAAEHTWGTDTKSYLDNEHYRPADLRLVLGEPGYRTMETSWAEKRDDLDTAVASLPAALGAEARARLAALVPRAPLTNGLRADTGLKLGGAHFTVALDPATGAITSLRAKASGREWASPDRPLALVTYQTLSTDEYTAYRARYIKSTADWAPRDFGKPGIERLGAAAREWRPALRQMWSAPDGSRAVLELAFDDAAAEAAGNVGWPRQMWVELALPEAEPRLDVTITTLGKPANRMPEALWLSFQPIVSEPIVPEPGGWLLDKVDEPVDPLGVVSGGGRAMHAIGRGLGYRDAHGSLEIASMDAPVVAVGERSPLNFSLGQPDLSKGFHFSLFNNAWGTNYPQWSGGDARYRFTLRGT